MRDDADAAAVIAPPLSPPPAPRGPYTDQLKAIMLELANSDPALHSDIASILQSALTRIQDIKSTQTILGPKIAYRGSLTPPPPPRPPRVSRPSPPPPLHTDAPAVHDGVMCDGCQASPLIGVRYKCVQCPDYDLCAACESKRTHTPSHNFIKMVRPAGFRVTDKRQTDGDTNDEEIARDEDAMLRKLLEYKEISDRETRATAKRDATTPPPQRARVDAQRHAKAMADLSAMGFTDTEKCELALIDFGYNMDAVVESLASHQ